jgi:hypothetical protein
MAVTALQGGCMAIEDGYQLSLTLDQAVQGVQAGGPVDIEGALRKYQSVSCTLHFCSFGVDFCCGAVVVYVRERLSLQWRHQLYTQSCQISW